MPDKIEEYARAAYNWKMAGDYKAAMPYIAAALFELSKLASK